MPISPRTILSLAVLGALVASTSAHAQHRTAAASAVELDTLVVIGEKTRAPGLAAQPTDVLSGATLAHRRQGGLGETLAGLPGVHLDNFGGGASRPVIRGQTLPRIEILSDGANLFDASSVSPDHAIGTDPLLLDAIEVIRGPAAVIYGGNAMNGAVNLIDSRVPKQVPEHGVTGAAEVRLGSGDQEKTGVARVTAGVGRFAVHADVARRHSDDYAIPGGELADSFAEGTSAAIGASWILDRGYVGVAHSQQQSTYGLPGHSHKNGVCHTHGIDLHCEAHGGYDDPFGSSDDHTAYIDLRHDRTDLRADIADPFPGFEHIRVRASHTDYRHDEIDGPALFNRYTHQVDDARVELTHRPLFGFSGVFGVQYTDGSFTGLNVNNLHVPMPVNGYGLVPGNLHMTEGVGVFLSERRSFGVVDLDIALRKDWRDIRVGAPTFRHSLTPAYQDLFEGWYGPDWEQVLRDEVVANYITRNPDVRQRPLSVSIGANWTLGDGYSAALSLARTERGPNVRELYAYGNNLATNSYEVGLLRSRSASPTFPANRPELLETTRSADLTFRKVGGPVEYEIGLFHQDIRDYVFARLIETENETGVPHNYLLYTAANARFTGVDGQVSLHTGDGHTLTVFGDIVRTRLEGEDDELPRIPPARLGVRHAWTGGAWSADAEYVHTFAQNRIASYETPTASYDLLNATVAYSLALTQRQSVEFYVRGTNLLNRAAYVHTSFVKDQSPLRGRSMVLGARYRF